MATGIEAFNALRAATTRQAHGSDYWITAVEKLDLCKLTASDLDALGFDEESAKDIESALSHQNLGPLGARMGLTLHTKFRVSAERIDGSCRIRCDNKADSGWLRHYLSQRFPGSNISEPIEAPDGPHTYMDVAFDERATAYAVREALITCPAIVLERIYDLRVAQQPHFRIEPYNFASWLEDQQEPWWTVDGDPLLMSRLEFPAPSDELAEAIRRIDKPLLVADPNGRAASEEHLPEDVKRVVDLDEHGSRILTLSWVNGDRDWQLVEDVPILDR